MGIWEWTEDHGRPYPLAYGYGLSYVCWPNVGTRPSIYMKFNSEGVYFLSSSRTEYPSLYPDSEANVSIKAWLKYGQIRKISENAWEAWHLRHDWTILQAQGGQNIATSNSMNGALLEYVEVPSGYEIWEDTLLWLEMGLTFYCSVRDYAIAIIDFQGWQDLPFWFLFDIWVVGAQPQARSSL